MYDLSYAALMSYVANDGPIITYDNGPGNVQRGGTEELHRIIIEDGRLSEFDLDVHGFKLIDFHSDIVRMFKDQYNAKSVHLFDKTLRITDEEERKKANAREAVFRIHNDYTEWSARKRANEFFGKDVDDFAILQIWHPLVLVESFPLAFCDYQTLDNADLVLSERIYPDRKGQTYNVAYNPNHKWYWFPYMNPTEAVLFKTFDTRNKAKWAVHSAFLTIEPMLPRKSMEYRAFVIF